MSPQMNFWTFYLDCHQSQKLKSVETQLFLGNEPMEQFQIQSQCNAISSAIIGLIGTD